jgi:uncharacterized protein
VTLNPTRLPGLKFEAVRAPVAEQVLRTDVGFFAGKTRRGPQTEAVRVEGLRQFEEVFGGLVEGRVTPYAVRGYFENGGEVAWIWRLGPPREQIPVVWQVGEELEQRALGCAGYDWTVGNESYAASLGLSSARYLVLASSPGGWANGAQVTMVLRRRLSARPVVDIFVDAGHGEREQLVGLPCDGLVEAVEARSTLLRLYQPAIPAPPVVGPNPLGPQTQSWSFALEQGIEPEASSETYEHAVDAAVRSEEPALFCFPDLHEDLQDEDARRSVLAATAAQFASTLDRLLLVDLPEPIDLASAADDWLSAFADRDALRSATAAYHPWLSIQDPLGTPAKPLRVLPPSGHVAGVISRLDRERGAAVTPANASIEGAVDLSRRPATEERVRLYQLGVNLLACQSGRGLVVWGGRTLGGELDSATPLRPTFVAHRRLIHRLVRAIRLTARPLVFDANEPRLWFALARGATTVLLQAWRSRALKGDRPEQAFRVRCDAELNTPQVIERGQVICEVSLAPAAPMEFITVRVALSADGQLEVAEP